MKVDKKFVDEHIGEILRNLRPDLVFEFFSKNWYIEIYHEEKRLGCYENGKLISGKWYNEEVEKREIRKLYDKVKVEAKREKIDFDIYCNKLLVKGKQKEGISWYEYDALIRINDRDDLT